MFKFNIKNSFHKARTGSFNTPHGKIQTPNLAIVATHGKIKLLNKTDHLRANPDLIIANTFHLFVNNKINEIKKSGGLHKWSEFKKPIMTDSGGFQVFSFGWGKVHKVGKVLTNTDYTQTDTENNQYKSVSSQYRSSSVKISEKGVVFEYDGKKFELTPEKSIKIQKDMGADIIFAFDECTSPLHSHSYTKKSINQTHRWAVRSLKAKNSRLRRSFGRQAKSKTQQALFGIVQGGIFEDLRKKSSKFIGHLPFEGFGIGGSFGEKQMEDVLKWSLSGLPEEKPRHLLGIGTVKDIFIAVKQGIDLFDCVVPTREARHGVLYTKAGKLAIKKGIFSKDKKLIERGCKCFICRSGITRQELRGYFKDPIQRQKGQRLVVIHNIYFYKRLFQEIREAITNGKLSKLEKEYSVYL
ncbi:MAG TPA: tRNA guanosine(34) transglycosylase Tgt [Candidatus Wolfebacteria bacterium]|nr:tRNA guanosine(34) transglycosylase Tgt [Candidatus Wolfebacteria bacterium]